MLHLIGRIVSSSSSLSAHHLVLSPQRSSLILTSPNLRCIKKSIQDKLDYSKVPELKEEDLEEQYVFGSGPGGQKVNKTANCVVLKHTPSGLVVKCHVTRELEKNRQIARLNLKTKLDILLNGEESIESQVARIEKEKSIKYKAKAAKLREQKRQFKEREGLK